MQGEMVYFLDHLIFTIYIGSCGLTLLTLVGYKIASAWYSYLFLINNLRKTK